jgi:hypothetical protein
LRRLSADSRIEEHEERGVIGREVGVRKEEIGK